MNEKLQENLFKIGLTKQESKTYIALIMLKEAKTGTLCKETGIASSNIYNVLDSLKNKGLVSYKIKNNIKIFIPSQPDVLNELFLEKQKKLENERKNIQELILQIKVIKNEENESNYRYYEGISGIKSMWYEIISMLPNLNNKKIIKVYSCEKEAYKTIVSFYKEFQKARKKNKFKQRIILPIGEKKVSKLKEFKDIDFRYIILKNEAEWGVIDNLVFIQYITTKTPRGFLIKDELFAQTFSQTFDQIWKKN